MGISVMGISVVGNSVRDTELTYSRDLNHDSSGVGALLAERRRSDSPVVAGQLMMEENLHISGRIVVAPEAPDLHLNRSLANNTPANIF